MFLVKIRSKLIFREILSKILYEISDFSSRGGFCCKVQSGARACFCSIIKKQYILMSRARMCVPFILCANVYSVQLAARTALSCFIGSNYY